MHLLTFEMQIYHPGLFLQWLESPPFDKETFREIILTLLALWEEKGLSGGSHAPRCTTESLCLPPGKCQLGSQVACHMGQAPVFNLGAFPLAHHNLLTFSAFSFSEVEFMLDSLPYCNGDYRIKSAPTSVANAPICLSLTVNINDYRKVRDTGKVTML